jgi:DNA repair protein RecO (recombination protein O)
VSLLTEEGILLRSHPYSESSRILRFLTPGYGILSVMARGFRKRASRGEGGVETFDQAVLVLNYRPERDLHTLRDLQPGRSRRGLGRDLLRFAGASLVAELIMAHTLQEANPSLYAQVSSGLDGMEKALPEALPGVVLATAWTVLVEAGFPPILDGCVRCGGELPPDGLLRFSAASGGLLCPSCGEGSAGARLGPGARRDLERLTAGDPPAPLRAPDAHLGLLEAHALHHLAPRKTFRSADLVRSILESRRSAGASGGAPSAVPETDDARAERDPDGSDAVEG